MNIRKYTIILLILLGITLLLAGCDKMKCKPDGKVYKGGGFYIGGKCNGEF